MKRRVLAMLLACTFLFSQGFSNAAYAAESTETEAVEAEENTAEEETVEEETAEAEETENEEENNELTEEETVEDTTVSKTDVTAEDVYSFEEAENADDTDTDGDGLSDYWEDALGTDKTVADTDGDGLSDYIEVSVTDTDPLLTDSDDNGVSDYDEDHDNDGLSNGEEVSLGTDAATADTDMDGLTDGDEHNTYGTDPLVIDTDSDGASDSFEVNNGFDPLTANTSFTMTFTSEDGLFAAKLTADGATISTVSIERKETSINADTSDAEATESIYTDSYTVNATGSLTGTVTFTRSTGSFTKASNSSVYMYVTDEDGNVTTEALNTDIVSGKASAFIKEAGQYVVLDSEALYEVQKAASKKSVTNTVEVSETDAASSDDFNNDGLSDDITKLLCDGTITTADGALVFGELTYDEVQACDDLDGDGLKNGEEVTVSVAEDGTSVATISSSPVNLDTDSDGIFDADDTAPLSYGMEGGIVGSLRMVTRYTDGASFTSGHAYLVFTSYVDNLDINVTELYNYYMLNSDYAEAVNSNSDFLLWRYTANDYTGADEDDIPTDEADYCLEVANSVYQFQNSSANGSASFTMSRGDFFSIGNYNLVSQTQAILGAFMNGDAGDQIEYDTILALYRAYKNDESITLAYVLTHFSAVIAELCFESYVLDEDVINGATEGGIYINREEYKQKWCQDQYANRIYETEITEKELNEMLTYYAQNNYYSVITHNCAKVASTAWNLAVGYERDENDELIQDESGNYTKTALYVQSRADGLASIMDTPAQISSVLAGWAESQPDFELSACAGTVTRHNTFVGKDVTVVRGTILTNTIGTQTYYVVSTADDSDNTASATESVTESSSNETVSTDTTEAVLENTDSTQASNSTNVVVKVFTSIFNFLKKNATSLVKTIVTVVYLITQ